MIGSAAKIQTTGHSAASVAASLGQSCSSGLPQQRRRQVGLRQVERHREGADGVERQQHALGLLAIGGGAVGARGAHGDGGADEDDADAGERARGAGADDALADEGAAACRRSRAGSRRTLRAFITPPPRFEHARRGEQGHVGDREVVDDVAQVDDARTGTAGSAVCHSARFSKIVRERPLGRRARPTTMTSIATTITRRQDDAARICERVSAEPKRADRERGRAEQQQAEVAGEDVARSRSCRRRGPVAACTATRPARIARNASAERYLPTTISPSRTGDE